MADNHPSSSVLRINSSAFPISHNSKCMVDTPSDRRSKLVQQDPEPSSSKAEIELISTTLEHSFSALYRKTGRISLEMS